jgi:hypothetical protein
MMSRVLFLSVLFFAASALYAPKAHAQFNQNNNSVCPADESYNQCIADGYTTSSGSGSGGSSKPDCGGKPTDGFSCLKGCKCQYDYYVKKCKNQRSCMDTQRVDYESCTTQCEIDFT